MLISISAEMIMRSNGDGTAFPSVNTGGLERLSHRGQPGGRWERD